MRNNGRKNVKHNLCDTYYTQEDLKSYMILNSHHPPSLQLIIAISSRLYQWRGYCTWDDGMSFLTVLLIPQISLRKNSSWRTFKWILRLFNCLLLKIINLSVLACSLFWKWIYVCFVVSESQQLIQVPVSPMHVM